MSIIGLIGRIPLLILLTVMTIVANSAYAGSNGGGSSSGGGGGGIIFVCADKPYLADSYEFMSKATPDYLFQLRRVSTDKAIEIMLATVKKVDPEMAATVESNYHALKFHAGGPRPFVGDDDITATMVPTGCEKVQLAEQFLRTGDPTYDQSHADIVEYDQANYWRLTSVERGLFRLHESYIRSFRQNTISVRGRVSRVAWSDLVHTMIDGLEQVVHGPCDTVQAVPFVNAVCLPELLHDMPKRIDQAEAFFCENNPAMDGFYDEERAFCSAMVTSFYSQIGTLVADLRTKKSFRTDDPGYDLLVEKYKLISDNIESGYWYWTNIQLSMQARGYKFVCKPAFESDINPESSIMMAIVQFTPCFQSISP